MGLKQTFLSAIKFFNLEFKLPALALIQNSSTKTAYCISEHDCGKNCFCLVSSVNSITKPNIVYFDTVESTVKNYFTVAPSLIGIKNTSAICKSMSCFNNCADNETDMVCSISITADFDFLSFRQKQRGRRVKVVYV